VRGDGGTGNHGIFFLFPKYETGRRKADESELSFPPPPSRHIKLSIRVRLIKRKIFIFTIQLRIAVDRISLYPVTLLDDNFRNEIRGTTDAPRIAYYYRRMLKRFVFLYARRRLYPNIFETAKILAFFRKSRRRVCIYIYVYINLRADYGCSKTRPDGHK